MSRAYSNFKGYFVWFDFVFVCFVVNLKHGFRRILKANIRASRSLQAGRLRSFAWLRRSWKSGTHVCDYTRAAFNFLPNNFPANNFPTKFRLSSADGCFGDKQARPG
jgi:hypothetical protein